MTPAKNQQPGCRTCGKPWNGHPGCEELCRRVQELETEVGRLRAERAVDHTETLLGIVKG